jgi:hypothetical protein
VILGPRCSVVVYYLVTNVSDKLNSYIFRVEDGYDTLVTLQSIMIQKTKIQIVYIFNKFYV